MNPAAAKARNETKKENCGKFYFFLGEIIVLFSGNKFGISKKKKRIIFLKVYLITVIR